LQAAQLAEIVAGVLPQLPRNGPKHAEGFTGLLDPNGMTFLATIASGETRLIDLQGRWRPGATHQFVGPAGNSGIILHGVNKWCALLIGLDRDSGRALFGYAYQRGPVTCTGTAAAGVDVYALMNDDVYGDNALDPYDPMRLS
jgi:hypothetical protein